VRYLRRHNRLQLNRYYGACAPGLEEYLAGVLKERFSDLAVPRILSGALVFDTSLSYERLNLLCFNNVFRVIGSRAGREQSPGTLGEVDHPSGMVLESFVRGVLRRRMGRDSLAGCTPAGSFRVVFSVENTPAAVGPALRREAEDRIASFSALRLDRSNPDTEFWFLLRREGAFFMRRLSRHRPWDKLLHPGELPPPLAWTLCRLSGPRPGETVADPFCGYGSIPAARVRHFPQAEFFASDIDEGPLRIARGQFKGKTPPRCHFNRLDVAELPRIIPPGGLDAVITDPPWGHYPRPLPAGGGPEQKPAEGAGRALEDLYRRSFEVFAGLLKPGGRIVMLCGRGEEAPEAAERGGFSLSRSLPILVSGKKAVIHVLETRAGFR
jgi:SAM-dependent methyltransferase